MRVVLEASAIQANPTGIGRYATELMHGLTKHTAIQQLYFDTQGHLSTRLDKPTAPSRLRKTLSRLKHFPGIKQLHQVHRLRHYRYLNQQAQIDQADLYHAPNFIFRPTNLPTAVTVHDFSFIHYPEFHPKELIRLFNRYFPRTLETAQHFITDSEFVRQELIRLFDVAPEKVTAIPLGVSPLFQPKSAAAVQATLNRYQLDYKNYLFSAATLEPRKNLSNLILAYSRLPLALQKHYPLVLAGAEGWLNQGLQKTLHQLERQGSLRYLGYLSDEHLRHIYAGAHGFAFPSIYEGFGFPVLEAMASGVPVLTSNAASIPELTRDAALLINPLSIDDITSGLEKLLSDTNFILEAQKKGLAIASEHTWEKCISKTINTYQTMLVN